MSVYKDLQNLTNLHFTKFDALKEYQIFHFKGVVRSVGCTNEYDNSKKKTIEIQQGKLNVIQINFWNDQIRLCKDLAEGDKVLFLQFTLQRV